MSYRDIAVPSYFNWNPDGWRHVCQIVVVVIVIVVGVGVGDVGGGVGGGAVNVTMVGVRRVVYQRRIGVGVGCTSRDVVGGVGSRFVFVFVMNVTTPRANTQSPFVIVVSVLGVGLTSFSESDETPVVVVEIGWTVMSPVSELAAV